VGIFAIFISVSNGYPLVAMAAGLVVYWRAQYIIRDDISTFYAVLFVVGAIGSFIAYIVNQLR
jgi:hypothetical protein